jgi:hypothetical protein
MRRDDQLTRSISARRPIALLRRRWRVGLGGATLLGALGFAGCAPSGAPADAAAGAPLPAASAAAGWREIQGTWTAAGSRQTIALGVDRRASIARLQGSLLLVGPARVATGFLAEAIVLNDSVTGMVGRAVWTDDRGDQVFSELRGEGTRTGNRITGTVIGGTGRYAGLVGDYEFSWKFVLEAEDGSVQGQSMGLKARLRPAPTPIPPAAPTTPDQGASRP